MKNKLAVIILTSVVCLLPLILSAVIYGDLPEQITVQWSKSGESTNIVHKAFAAFGSPFILAILNFISKLRLYSNPKKENVSTIMLMIYEWLIPLISVVMVPISLIMAMDVNIPINIIASTIVGVMFIVFGNYLPKNRQNYVIGIKLPWTLHDADNWNKTNRLAGYLWIFGGIALIVSSFITFENSVWIALSLVILLIIVIVPSLYSYLLFRRSGDNKSNVD